MTDKMMRIAGRSSDGTARAIKTDDEGRLITEQTNNEIYAKTLSTTIPVGETIELLSQNIEHSYFMFNLVFQDSASVGNITISVYFFPRDYPTDILSRSIMCFDENVKDEQKPEYWMGRNSYMYSRFSDWMPVYGGKIAIYATNHDISQPRAIRHMELRGKN